MSKLLATFFCITAMLLSPTHSIEISKAAEITAHEFIRSCKSITYIVTIEGSIVGGDAEKLSSNLMGRSVTSVLLNSPGGDVLEAMKISELLNHRIITATAPIDLRKEHAGRIICGAFLLDSYYQPSDPRNCVCNSACAIIWLTAPRRTGDYVGVHRPRFDYKYFSGLSTAEAEKKYGVMQKTVEEFLSSHDVPNEIIARMMSIPSRDNYILSSSELAHIGEERPFLGELLHAKCSAFHDEFNFLQAKRQLIDTRIAEIESKIELEGETAATNAEDAALTQDLIRWWNDWGQSNYNRCQSNALGELREERQTIQ